MTVIVYTGPSCQACVLTKRVLDREEVIYEERPVAEWPSEAEAIASETGRRLPLVDAGVQRWSGFRPDLIAALVRG